MKVVDDVQGGLLVSRRGARANIARAGRTSVVALIVLFVATMRVEQDPQTSSPTRDFVRALSKVAVLVVDDDRDVTEILGVILERAGFTVAACGNGQEALSMLRIVKPDLILLDIEMPVMDGAEFRQAQRQDKDLIRIPTIVMTGSKREPILDLGVVGVLCKPFHSSLLLEAVARYSTPSS